MKEASTINRRNLLFAATPAATTMILGVAATEGTIAEASTPVTNYTPVFFNSVEWSFINAAVGRLIPSDGHGPGGLETGVPEFIDRQMELPYGHGAYFYLQGPFQPDAPATLGYQLRYTPRELYRSGIAAANDACRTAVGKVFADLAPDEQDRFLSSLEKGQIQLSGPPAAAFFAQLLENAREGYFADPPYGGNRGMAAWKWIGFPGARADFTDWIDQAGQKYPTGRWPSAERGGDGGEEKTRGRRHHWLWLDRRHHGEDADRCRPVGGRARARSCARHRSGFRIPTHH